jgi:ATPase subunit of ABC transporter with duplicated ATPase domains
LIINEEVTLLNGKLNFHIDFERRESVGLIGENGIGKSSIFNYLKIHKNKIFLDKKIAFVDQGPVMALPHLRVVDLFNWLEKDGLVYSYKENELWEMGQFSKLWLRPLSKLSGGEGQLVKLLVAFSMQANYLFLDEPLQYLDINKRETVLQLIKKYPGKKMVIEHDRSSIEYLTKDICQLGLSSESNKYFLDWVGEND